MLKPNTQWDSIGRWGLGWCLGHVGEVVKNRIDTFVQEALESSLAPFTTWKHPKKVLFMRKWALPDTICWHQALELFSFQNWETSVVYKSLTLWYFYYGSLNGLRIKQKNTKLLNRKDNARGNPRKLESGNAFLNTALNAWFMKEKLMSDFIKIKKLWSVEHTPC